MVSDEQKKINYCKNRCKANKNNGLFCCMTYGMPNPVNCDWIFIENNRVKCWDLPEDL